MNNLKEKPNIEERLKDISLLGVTFQDKEGLARYVMEYSCKYLEREGISPSNHLPQLYEVMNTKLASLEHIVKQTRAKFPSGKLTVFAPVGSVDTILDFESGNGGNSYWVLMLSEK